MAEPKKPSGDAQDAGSAGEDYAAASLEAEGFHVIARNFRTRQGEIDIVARNARYLVFAEVKARKPGSMVRAEEAVDFHKQRRLRLAAEHYLAQYPTPLQPRFDVICVEHGPDGTICLRNWIENAF